MLKSVAYVFINPIFWLVLFAALYFILRTLNKPKTSRFALYTFFLWVFIIYTSPVPQYLVYELENDYAIFEGTVKEDAIYILVLGGGNSEERMVEGVRLYHQLGNAKLIFSGGTNSSKYKSVAERMAIKSLFLKVSSKDTLMNIRPKNTRQEAAEYLKRFGKKMSLVLVTSAAHMPRAVAIFKENKLFPIAAPTDYRVIDELGEVDYNFKPSINKLRLMEIAMKEYAGLLWLKIIG